jgi:hypothetical protein
MTKEQLKPTGSVSSSGDSQNHFECIATRVRKTKSIPKWSNNSTAVPDGETNRTWSTQQRASLSFCAKRDHGCYTSNQDVKTLHPFHLTLRQGLRGGVMWVSPEWRSLPTQMPQGRTLRVTSSY